MEELPCGSFSADVGETQGQRNCGRPSKDVAPGLN